MVRKIVNLFLIILVFLNLSVYNVVYADTADDVINGARSFVQRETDSAMDESKLKEASDFIFNILLAIAMIVAVAVGVALGIKFMTSSVEEQAKVKEMLLPYVAGCIVVFGAMGIWKLAVNAFKNF